MGCTYQILGRTYQPHQLFLATLGLIIFIDIPKSCMNKQPKVVDIKAHSKEEEQFIKGYLEKHHA